MTNTIELRELERLYLYVDTGRGRFDCPHSDAQANQSNAQFARSASQHAGREPFSRSPLRPRRTQRMMTTLTLDSAEVVFVSGLGGRRVGNDERELAGRQLAGGDVDDQIRAR